MKILNLMIAFFAVLLITSSTVHGQEFYQGQTIQIVVGFAAGGGFDTYLRAIAKHLGRNIPGIPISLS
ncbi:MAG TPA: hypothetical protein VLJ79_35640 [Candidatus Binatia bacterium]|nr:hypothetical protein [Candidatus Binatia bacterium]